VTLFGHFAEFGPIRKEAVLTLAVMGVGRRSSAPGHVIEEGQALIAVWPSGVMLADAHAPTRSIRTGRFLALGRVPVALAPKKTIHSVNYRVFIMLMIEWKLSKRNSKKMQTNFSRILQILILK
jgi:hypothetical protein